MKENLTSQEQKLIAALTSDPAYLLLLDKIKMRTDDLMDELYLTENKEKIAEILPYWRALKTCYFELKNTPENFALYLDEFKKESMAENDTIANARITSLFEKIAEKENQSFTAQNTPIPFNNII